MPSQIKTKLTSPGRAPLVAAYEAARASPLRETWERLRPDLLSFDDWLRAGEWERVVESADQALLRTTLRLDVSAIMNIQSAARALRERRLRS